MRHKILKIEYNFLIKSILLIKILILNNVTKSKKKKIEIKYAIVNIKAVS